MAKDWQAVALAIQQRLNERDLTQAQLAVRAGVAPETVRELRNNLRPRRRNPRTLTAISEALGWPPDHLANLLRGDQPADSTAGKPDELSSIRDELANIAGRLSDIAGRLTNLNGHDG